MKTESKSRLAIATLLFGLLTGVQAAGQSDKQGEALLQAAKNMELVKGDLNAAIEQYKKIPGESQRKPDRGGQGPVGDGPVLRKARTG